jgi:exodeoxyribonuclease-5
MVKLSEEQTRVYDEIMQWFHQAKGQQRFVLAGYAGAGKTTLAKFIAEAIGNVHFCAYTVKAANVLREKGCSSASTIHGTIYTLIDDEDGEPRFTLDYESKIKDARLVIVDEYSMLSEEIIDDLEKLAKRILYLGDPFQLPPVDGECSLKPNRFITEVHRQALDSPILRAATDVRLGKALEYCNQNEFAYQPRRRVAPEHFYNADQVIVGYNKTRHAWNDRFRQRKGFSGTFPQAGEKLICLRNNHEKGLFNGMIDLAGSDSAPIDTQKIELRFGQFKNLEASAYYFRREPHPSYLRDVEHFDFGYVITCHKSQGSEFDNVLIYNQPIGRGVERQRWLYTALTRGKKKVILVDPE